MTQIAKVRMEIELEYEPALMHGDDVDARRWFFTTVLGDPLELFSPEIGDYIGTVHVLNVLVAE